MWCDTLICDICSDESKNGSLTIFDCKHKFCAICCEKLHVNVDDQTVVCSLDEKPTKLNEGFAVKTVADLPRQKEGLNIICETCQKSVSLENFWLCLKCQVYVCSYCAMKNHKKHPCHNITLDELMGQCTSIMMPIVEKTSDFNQKIDSFCMELMKRLKSHAEIENQNRNFVSVCDRYLDNESVVINSLKEKPTTDIGMQKKLKLVSSILPMLDSDNSIAFSKEMRINKTEKFKDAFPTVEEVADLFVNFKETKIENNESAVQLAEDGRENFNIFAKCANVDQNSNLPPDVKISYPLVSEFVSDVNAKTTTDNDNVDNTENKEPILPFCVCEPNAITLDLTSPFEICSISKKVIAILDRVRITLCSNIKVYECKGLPAINSPDFCQQKPSLVFHKKRNSLFVLNKLEQQVEDKIVEFQVQKLILKQTLTYPSLKSKHRDMLGVLSSGDLLLVTSFAMIIIDPENKRAIKRIWSHKGQDYEIFEELIVQNCEKIENRIFVMATSKIYMFGLHNNGTSVNCMKCIAIGYNWPFFLLGDSVYGLNVEKKRLECVEDSQKAITVSDKYLLPALDGSIVQIAVVDRKIYFLHCQSHTLYRGTLPIENISVDKATLLSAE